MVVDGTNFVVGDKALLVDRFNKKTWFIGTGAQIAALSPEQGQHAHCTSTGSGFTAIHDYLYTGAAWIDITGSMIVLITADNTDGTSVSLDTTEQISKSYTLAANTYTTIIMEAVVYGSVAIDTGGTQRSLGVGLHIGGSSRIFADVVTIDLEAGTSGHTEITTTLKYSAALQAGGTIKVVIPAGTADNDVDMQCKSLFVYGVV